MWQLKEDALVASERLAAFLAGVIRSSADSGRAALPRSNAMRMIVATCPRAK